MANKLCSIFMFIVSLFLFLLGINMFYVFITGLFSSDRFYLILMGIMFLGGAYTSFENAKDFWKKK